MVCLDDLIEGCKNGDKSMQKALYDRYSPQFYALCRRFASCNEAANEILTEGFLAIFNNINDYQGKGPFEAWMRIIFLRQAIRVYRRDLKHQQMLGDTEVLASEHTALPLEMQLDIREAITLAMQQLPNLQRQVFNLIAIEGYTFPETANLLQLPQPNIKSAYYTAKEQWCGR